MEMDKRFLERSTALDKRLTDIDRMVDLKVELAIRTHFEQHLILNSTRTRSRKAPDGGRKPGA